MCTADALVAVGCVAHVCVAIQLYYWVKLDYRWYFFLIGVVLMNLNQVIIISTYEGRSINKLQNSVILLVVQI